MTLALRPATLHSKHHHSFPVHVDINFRKDESDSSANGFLMDANDPERRVEPCLLQKIQFDEPVLSLEGEYWQIFIFDKQGIIYSAHRVSRPKWLDNSMRFGSEN